MTISNYKNTRTSLGLVLIVLVAIGTGVLSMDIGSWKKLDGSRLAMFSVGELADKKCCIKSEKIRCQDDDAWQCGNPPITCTQGDYMTDDCQNASCNTTSDEGDRCGVDSGGWISVSKCTADGEKTTTGCSGDQEKCTYDTGTSQESLQKCANGSTLCGDGQPTYSCE